jgi:hypothetical protein
MPRTLLIALVLLLLSACDMLPFKKSDEAVLARVHNKYLYASAIEDLFSENQVSSQDSISIVSNYINQWIRQQLMLHHAENNLLPAQKDFSRQLEDYRTSLTIFEYESSYIRQNLDTVVSVREIQEYYDLNRGNFELKQNIVKVNYVQLESDPRELSRLRRLWNSRDDESRKALERHCIQNGLKFSLFDDSWVYFNDLLNELPIKTYNQENFLQYNRNIEARDSLYVYLIEFADFRVKESVAPLSMHETDIRKIIINKRKLDLLKHLQQDVFDKALSNNHFETF